ncbi:MAG: TetR/AcrR family transcriptional regulator [Anaerolineaceae bacterium]|nr:TetR/AcrR family transcriptional regulator [Anaerolineaceae bacterium]
MVREQGSKGEQTRTRIVDAAYSLFIQRGYAATSMRAIAEASGLALGGLYAHFKGKEDIWVEVFKARHPYHEIMPLLMAAEGDTFENLIRDAIARTVQALGKRDDLYNLMFIELVEFGGKNISSVADQLLPMMPRLGLKLFGKKAKLRPISPVTFARALGGLVLIYHLSEQLMPPAARMLAPHNGLEEMVDIFLYGVMADDEPSRRKHD